MKTVYIITEKYSSDSCQVIFDVYATKELALAAVQKYKAEFSLALDYTIVERRLMEE